MFVKPLFSCFEKFVFVIGYNFIFSTYSPRPLDFEYGPPWYFQLIPNVTASLQKKYFKKLCRTLYFNFFLLSIHHPKLVCLIRVLNFSTTLSLALH